MSLCAVDVSLRLQYVVILGVEALGAMMSRQEDSREEWGGCGIRGEAQAAALEHWRSPAIVRITNNSQLPMSDWR